MSKIASQVAAHERVANENGRADWTLYAEHRESLTSLLLGACPQGGSIALLGAGNCNDVDVEALLAHVGQVHLIDIDREAISSARARLPESLRSRVFLHAPIELSGLFDVWSKLQRRVPTFTEMDAWPAVGVKNVQAALPEKFDVVASCCVLTQMSWGLHQSLGPNCGYETQAREALVAAHLRSLCALAAGGKALLACDMISTEYYPLDDLAPDTDLKALMERLISEQNYYQGANPALVRRLLRRDVVVSQAAKTATWHAPWLWRGPKQRTYLVYALELAC